MKEAEQMAKEKKEEKKAEAKPEKAEAEEAKPKAEKEPAERSKPAVLGAQRTTCCPISLIPAKCRRTAELPELLPGVRLKSLRRETKWRWRQSGANASPQSGPR